MALKRPRDERDIPQRCEEFVAAYGGIRKAADALGIDHGYFSRLCSGEKQNPSAKVLRKLHLIRKVYYVTTGHKMPSSAEREGE